MFEDVQSEITSHTYNLLESIMHILYKLRKTILFNLALKGEPIFHLILSPRTTNLIQIWRKYFYGGLIER